MSRLPLFPLNTVLFPGMQIKLHIFEERYKQMINQCVDEDQPFGVVLIQDGTEANGPLAQPHEIGCTAKITYVQRLPEGRMYLLAVGSDRFRINELHHDEPYLVGDVDMFPLEKRGINRQNSAKLRPLLIEYLKVLQQISEVKFDPEQLPENPEALAYLAAIILQTDNEKKQELLAVPSASDLYYELLKTYQMEIRLLETMMNLPESPGPFSLN